MPSICSSNSADVITSLNHAIDKMQPQLSTQKQHFRSLSAAIPKTSHERRQFSHNDTIEVSSSPQDTVLYLGYGSNLAAETFLGRRGIRPVSQINVVVPSIHLTFDLPGLPYSEPCFGNCRYRSAHEKPSPDDPPYHKDAWKKGLVGVVYEVTKKDFAHIIATEGGGSSYHDILVDCHPLSDDPNEDVPLEPTNTPFKAHTLYVPEGRSHRSDPNYAQPSARYLKLIHDGAEEHNLPKEYRFFLSNIRAYRTSTTAQKIGRFVFLAIWGPFLALFFGGSKVFARPDGTFPAWLAAFGQAFFGAVWGSYDQFFYPIFGDGERTLEDKNEDAEGGIISQTQNTEKSPLLAGPMEGLS